MSTLREKLGTPGIWFSISFAGMPRLYDIGLTWSLALIVVAFPIAMALWFFVAMGARARAFLAIAYTILSVAYLAGIAAFLDHSGAFARTGIQAVYFGHAAVGVWAIVRAIIAGFSRDGKIVDV